MTTLDLVAPLRWAIAATAVLCVTSFSSAIRENSRNGEHRFFLRALKYWAVTMGALAFVFSHTGLFGLPGRYLPFGVVPGFLVAFWSLKWRPARAAFGSLNDNQIRTLMAYRAIFGAFLLAGAALELFPPVFAMTAGLGDLLAGWLALGAPIGSLTSRKNRVWQWITHGWGTLDLFDVAVLGTFVVRPWLIDHQSLGPSFLLPWMAVPLLLALNLHGLLRANEE